jgi:DNA primase
MDGDAPGRQAQHNVIDGLREYTNVRVIDTPDGEDPASLESIPVSYTAFEYLISNK